MTTRKNVSVEQILPEIKVGGIDYSLLTQREWHLMKIYNDLRQELKKAYPKKIPENYDPLNYSPEEIEDGYDLDIEKAKNDYRAHSFTTALTKAQELLHKIETINILCTPYEINCLRFYCKYLVNALHKAKGKKRQKKINEFLSIFKDNDLYEIVESYFKIMRKYGLPVNEEPYYWMSPNRRRDIKYECEMLKRSTLFDDNEIRISILEELE